MARTEAEIDRLAKAWCSWYDRHAPDDEWAEQELIVDVIEADASVDECWTITLRLLEKAPNNAVLGIVGAGPIEDLLAREPMQVADVIRLEAASNRRLRKAIGHVWRMPAVPEDVCEKVIALALAFG